MGAFLGVDACNANITADKSAALNAERENNAAPTPPTFPGHGGGRRASRPRRSIGAFHAGCARTRRMRTGGRKNAFPAPPCGAGRPAALLGHSGEFAPAPTPDSATRVRRTRTAANPLPANRAKIAPGRAGNVRGGIIPRNFPVRPAYPPNLQNLGGLADAPAPARTFPRWTAATAAENATIRPAHFPNTTHKESICYTPPKKAFAVFAIAVAAVLGPLAFLAWLFPPDTPPGLQHPSPPSASVVAPKKTLPRDSAVVPPVKSTPKAVSELDKCAALARRNGVQLSGRLKTRDLGGEMHHYSANATYRGNACRPFVCLFWGGEMDNAACMRGATQDEIFCANPPCFR